MSRIDGHDGSALDLARRLRHVRWLGGGSGAGKSTVARRLVAEHDLVVYATDAHLTDHAERCPPGDCPDLEAFSAMSTDERWLLRTPEEMLRTFPWFGGEGFGLVVEDLLALPTDRVVLVEGFRLLPALVAPLLSAPRQAVWLLPTPEFRRAALASRGGLWEIAGRTSAPARALENLLTRDRMFTDELRRQARLLGLTVEEVDRGRSERDSVDRVAQALGLTAGGHAPV
ncbi:hypothetical protein [Kineococcus rubinsiae]|uniref:hypothetical protein n=1 Tax=Kineococcus rubinsiae TaxID=2609562 RepID=UPI001AD8CA49|nr:hypothetical protein [Kineococcus rubinsiae]